MASFFTAQFTGGMNEIIHPSLLDEKTAVLLRNANIENGKISSIRKLLRVPLESAESAGHYGTPRRSVVKFYNRTYWSNNNSNTSYYGGDEENYLGIPYPIYSQHVKFEKQSGGTLTGEFKYCVTFVNPNGWESAPGALLDYEKVQVLNNQQLKITVTWNDAKISYAKIYRTQKEGADFYCIGKITESGGEFEDKTDDYTLVGLEPLTSINNYPPPDGGKYLCEANGVFFLACGSTLHFSELGNPHAWPPLNFIGFDDTITGIVSEFQGVLVFTRSKAYRVIGADDAATVSKIVIPGNQGCTDCNSISKLSNAPIWLSYDGLCMWDGENVSIISQRTINTQNMAVKKAITANDCYYLFTSRGAIVFNRRNGNVFYTLGFPCDYAWYNEEMNIIFLQRGKQFFEFNAGNKTAFTYISPYIGLPESDHNYFREVILTASEKTTVTVTVDGQEVLETTFNKEGKHRLKLPHDTIGRFAQIKVSSFGYLNELVMIYN